MVKRVISAKGQGHAQPTRETRLRPFRDPAPVRSLTLLARYAPQSQPSPCPTPLRPREPALPIAQLFALFSERVTRPVCCLLDLDLSDVQGSSASTFYIAHHTFTAGKAQKIWAV